MGEGVDTKIIELYIILYIKNLIFLSYIILYNIFF